MGRREKCPIWGRRSAGGNNRTAFLGQRTHTISPLLEYVRYIILGRLNSKDPARPPELIRPLTLELRNESDEYAFQYIYILVFPANNNKGFFF